jgi:hypothetical protein
MNKAIPHQILTISGHAADPGPAQFSAQPAAVRWVNLPGSGSLHPTCLPLVSAQKEPEQQKAADVTKRLRQPTGEEQRHSLG